MGPADQPSKLGELVFFPGGSGTPIPVSKLDTDLGIQTDNTFSHSAQRTGATTDLHYKALLP